MTESAPLITAEDDAAFDAFDSHEGIGLIRPRVARQLLEGLANESFGYGYLWEEQQDLAERDTHHGAKHMRQALANLAEARYGPLTGGYHNYQSYKYGFRVSRILMELLAQDTVGEIKYDAESIVAYTTEIHESRHPYRGPEAEQQAQFIRRLSSGNNGMISHNKYLEVVAREIEKYQFPEHRWQIRMGIYDAYMIGRTKMNGVFASNLK